MNYKILKKIPVVFHNGSTYDYHFITKELAKEFEGQFDCLGENTEKYITFSVPINKKVTKIDKDNSEKAKTLFYKLKFIDSFRFMSTSLSSLVNNLSNGLYNDKCTYCKSCLDYISVKDNQLIFNCLKYNKYHNKDFNKDLINRFASTYKFCDGDIHKFILLLRKRVYLYEYMDGWERSDETSLPKKKIFMAT